MNEQPFLSYCRLPSRIHLVVLYSWMELQGFFPLQQIKLEIVYVRLSLTLAPVNDFVYEVSMLCVDCIGQIILLVELAFDGN